MAGKRLACPNCGNTGLWSEEVAAIMYPVVLTREHGGVSVEYTGESYDVMDEGTEYKGSIWCRDCSGQPDEDDLVEEGSDATT